MSLSKERQCMLISGYCRLESGDMHMIDGILPIIFKYQRTAKWSNEFKRDEIELSGDNTQI